MDIKDLQDLTQVEAEIAARGFKVRSVTIEKTVGEMLGEEETVTVKFTRNRHG